MRLSHNTAVLLVACAACQAGSSGCPAGQTAADGACTAPSGQEEDTSLLQRVGVERSRGSPEASMRRSLHRMQGHQGGGFRAMAAATGLAAGLLTYIDGEGEEKFRILFDKVDIFAGNSGGSWYNLQNLYSERIQEMQLSMASSPSEAGEIYNHMWTDVLLFPVPIFPSPTWKLDLLHCIRSMRPNRALELDAARNASEPAEEEPGASSGVPILEWLDIIYVLLKKGAFGGGTWQTVVDLIMGRPALISPNASLSSNPNRWALGKLMLTCTSVPTPGSPGSDSGNVWLYLGFNAEIRPQSQISYEAKGYRLPKFTPGKFTFWLGEGSDADSPFPFCAEEDCFDISLEYTGFSARPPERSYHGSTHVGQIYKSAFMKKAGNLPISSVAASSSAFGGTAIMSQPQGTGAMLQGLVNATADCLNLAVWANKAPDGKAFEEAQKQQNELYNESRITAESVHDVAEMGLQGLVDGVFTDDIGIANSLGVMTQKARRDKHLQVIAWLNGLPVSPALLNLFPGAPNVSVGPVFAFPTYDMVVEQMRTSPAVLPDSDAKWLTNITYGTIQDCLTVDNKWYGVRKGFVVDIHFLWVVTSMGIGGTDAFRAFGVLAGEVTKTMADNAATLRRVARAFYGF